MERIEWDDPVQDMAVHRPRRPNGFEPAGLERHALEVIRGTRSVHRPLRPVGFAPADLGWHVLPVRQDTASVHRPLRPVGSEPVGLEWHALQANTLMGSPIGQEQLSEHDPNLVVNGVAAAAFIAPGDISVAAAEAGNSGRGGPWPILLPGHAVVVVDDRRDKIDRFGVAREVKNKKMLEKNMEAWTIWGVHSISYGETHNLPAMGLMMRDRTPIQQVEQLMSFLCFLLEEEEMNGKEMRSCVTNVRLFFKVYNPTAEEAFKTKLVTNAIKEENKLTLQAQAEQARQRLGTQTQPIAPVHVLSLATTYFDEADESTEDGLRVMSAFVGVFTIVNWGPRIGHVCGPYPGRRDHSLLVRDLWFYLVLIVADTEVVERICATQSVSVVEERIRLGAVVVDKEFWLPTNKAVRENAETVPPARIYRLVGAGKDANPLQARALAMFFRYWKAAHLQDRPDASFFAPALYNLMVPLRPPQRKTVNDMFKEAAISVGLADSYAEAGAFTSKSGRNLVASLVAPVDGSQTQEWAATSNVPRNYYLRPNAALGGTAAPAADTERVMQNVVATRVSTRHTTPT